MTSELPCSFRLDRSLVKRLRGVSTKANTAQVVILETALEQFMEKHPSANQVIDAVLTHRRSKLKP